MATGGGVTAVSNSTLVQNTYTTLATTQHALIRWGIAREPSWTYGTSATAPLALATLVTKTVAAGKTGQLFGFHISAGEANSFQISGGTTTLTYHLAAAGPIDIVLSAPIIANIAAGASITIKNVTAAAAGIVYQASLLTDEA